MLDAEQCPATGPLREQGAAPAEIHHERHHQLLAERIDRGVGHLGETLAHIGVEALRQQGQRRDWRVVAHTPDRIATLGGHGRDHITQVLVAVAKRMLARGELVRGERRP